MLYSINYGYGSDSSAGEKGEEDGDSNKKPRIPASERLLKARKIFISTDINPKTSQQVVTQLLLMAEDDPDKYITMIINSPGGSVYDGFAIFDMMKAIKPPIKTVIAGVAASFGSILAVAAEKGDRYILPNAKVMIHQPLIPGMLRGSATDIEIETKEMVRVKERIIQVYVDATGKTKAEIRDGIERNNWLNADETVAYGLADKIITDFSIFDSSEEEKSK